MNHIQQLNDLRSRVLTVYIISIVLCVLGMVSIGFGYGFFFIIVGIILLLINLLSWHKDYKKKYKEWIVEDALSGLFDVEIYDPMHGFEKERTYATSFTPKGNTYSSDDYLKGSYQGVGFERSDVHIQQVTSNGKTTTTVTYFLGSWTIFDAPKNIRSYMLIRKDTFFKSKPGGWFSSIPNTTRVETESVKFNDQFDVYAQDEHDAFYFLNPVMMEKIMDLNDYFDQKMIIGFQNGKLHVLNDSRKNVLEPKLWDEVTDADITLVRASMSYIPKIINTLNLKGE